MLVYDKSFYKTIIAISVPIALQNLIGFLVNLIDTLMLGRLGETALSSVNLAGQMFFITMVVCVGISEGCNVLIAQYWGKKDVASIHKIYAIGYRAAVVLGLIAMSIAFFFPEQFMRIYSRDAEVIAEGAKYLRIMAFSYVPYAFTSVNIMMLRGVRSTKISIVVYGISFAVNAILNYGLIFGNFGLPRLEIEGAAIATTIARFVEVIVIVIYLKRFDKKVMIKLKSLVKVDKDIFKNFVKHSTPILINEIFWVLGSSCVSIIFGRLGKEVVAANAISSVMFQFASIFLMGIASSSLVMIGNVIGEGKIEKAYDYSKTFLVLAVGLGVFSMCSVFLLKDFVISFYVLEESTKVLAREILNANGIVLFFQTIAIVSGMGILRGGGDSRFMLVFDVASVWFLALPFGVLAAFYFQLPIFWIFLAVKIDEIIKSAIFVTRILFSRWARDMTVIDEGGLTNE